MHLTLCGFIFPPWTEEGSDKNMKGLIPTIFNLLTVKHNITYTILRKSMNDSLDMMTAGTCDICVKSVGLSWKRFKAYTLSVDFSYTEVLVLSTQPSEKYISSWADTNFFAVNKNFVVLMVVMMFIFFAVTLLAEIWRSDNKLQTVNEVLWMYYRSLFSEPFGPSLVSVASKLMASVWWLVLLVPLSLLEGDLKASLASEKHMTIDSLQDILERPKLRVMMIANWAEERYFREIAVDAESRKVYNQIVKTKGAISWETLTEGKIPGQQGEYMEIFQRKAVAILADTDIITLLDSICGSNPKFKKAFYIGKSRVGPPSYDTIIMKRDIPRHVLELINQELRYMASTGHERHAFIEMNLRKDQCVWSEEKRTTRIHDFSRPLASIWLVGMSISCVILLSETIYFRFCSDRPKISARRRCRTLKRYDPFAVANRNRRRRMTFA